ncbi:hypothetical protein JHD50_03600 [Sulfurimonas sp. MAG313]|nr:hypothetical protein [Sulfurimonas sp. MAG313]MDF1880395.1 hypothetical protein [Sulfurimonas sp. MAG313]
MTNELIFLILFVFAEVFELLWQKSPTLLVMIEKIYAYYQKSPYLLYLMHPSYILSLYLYYASHYNTWILLILLIKSLDIIFKVLLIHKHFILNELDQELKHVLTQALHPLLFALGLSLYPYLLYLALF